MSSTDSKQGSNSYTGLVSLLILLIQYLLYMSLWICNIIFTNVFTGDNKEFLYLILSYLILWLGAASSTAPYGKYCTPPWGLTGCVGLLNSHTGFVLSYVWDIDIYLSGHHLHRASKSHYLSINNNVGDNITRETNIQSNNSIAIIPFLHRNVTLERNASGVRAGIW